MGTTAELHGEVAHLNDANHITVLFAEHCNSALLLGLLNGQHFGDNAVAFQNGIVDDGIDLSQLLGSDGFEMGKVKTQAVGLHQRACLMDMIAQHTLQSFMQQVGGAVCTHDGAATLQINRSGDRFAQMQFTGNHLAGVHKLAALVLLNIGDFKLSITQRDHAMVSSLTAHFGIEGSLIQHQNGFGTGSNSLTLLLFGYNGQNLGLSFGLLIAYKHGLGNILTELNTGPAQIAQSLAGFTGAHLLFLHQLIEGFLIHRQASLGNHFLGQINGETVGIVQFEGIGTGKGLFILFLMTFQHFTENLQATVDGLGEVLFLHTNHAGDIFLTLLQFRVMMAVFLHDGIHNLKQEGLIHAQQLAMTGSAAQQAAQHVAAAFVGRQDAVANHEGSRTDVVGNNTQGDITLIALAIFGTGQLRHLVGDVHDSVNLEQAVDALHDTGQTFQTHTGINVLLAQLGIIAVTIVIKLGENVIPDLHVTVAVTANGTTGLAAAILGTTVIVDLGAGATGTGAMLPEVISLAKTENMIGGNTNLLVPDLIGFIIGRGSLIALKNRGVQTVRIQTQHLSQELPAVSDGLLLEIIAKGEVAQHLKISAMTGSLTHVVNIAGADALLASADTLAGRLFFTLEPGLHRGHTCIDQQNGCVVLRHQRKAGQTQMILTLKIAEEQLSQFIQTFLFHNSSSSFIVSFLYFKKDYS